MDIQLVRRIANPNNKPILKKAVTIEELEQPFLDTDAQLSPQKTVDATVPPQPTYVNQPDDISSYPPVSVGNSGCLRGDIWRDIRIDSFKN